MCKLFSIKRYVTLNLRVYKLVLYELLYGFRIKDKTLLFYKKEIQFYIKHTYMYAMKVLVVTPLPVISKYDSL